MNAIILLGIKGFTVLADHVLSLPKFQGIPQLRIAGGKKRLITYESHLAVCGPLGKIYLVLREGFVYILCWI